SVSLCRTFLDVAVVGHLVDTDVCVRSDRDIAQGSLLGVFHVVGLGLDVIQLAGEEDGGFLCAVEAGLRGRHNGGRDSGVAQGVELRAVEMGMLGSHCSVPPSRYTWA